MHCPGQLVFYPLWDVRLYKTLSQYRWDLEEAVIRTLQECGLNGTDCFRKAQSPGVFTSKGKIASMGLRLHRNGVYHGISLNIACPLLPFQNIVCCGDPLQQITSLAQFGLFPSMQCVKTLMKAHFYQLIL